MGDDSNAHYNNVIYRISKLFQDARDPRHIDDIKARFHVENLTVQTMLHTAIEQELDEITRGVSILSSSSERSGHLKQQFDHIQQLVKESHDHLANDYETIKTIAVARRNSMIVRNLAKNLQHLPDLLTHIKTVLDSGHKESMKKDEPLMILEEHLLTVHYALAQIDRFRYTILLSMRTDTSDETWQSMEKKFELLSYYYTLFEQQLWLWTRNLFQLFENHPKMIMKIMKVINYEERIDWLKTTYLGNVTMRFSPKRDYLTKFKHQQKGWVDMRFSRLVEPIEQHVYQEIEKLDPNDIPKVDANLTIWEKVFKRIFVLMKDLQFIHEKLNPLFPPQYELFQFYVHEYHSNVYYVMRGMMQKMELRTLSSKNLLFLARWIQEYYTFMEHNFGFVAEDKVLQPPLWDEQLSSFMDHYVQLARTQMEEWVDNLIVSERKEYTDRKKPPEMNHDGKYMTGSPSILFQLVHQQIDLCLQSHRGLYFYQIVLECCQVIKRYQEASRKLLRSETKKFLDNPGDASPGIIEYWMAIANSHFLCRELTVNLNSKIRIDMSRPFIEKMGTRLDDVIHGFHTVTMEVLHHIVAISLLDLEKIFKALFTNLWYQTRNLLAQRMISTLTDYRDDFKARMNSSLFSHLMDLLSKAFVVRYLECLITKKDTEIILPYFIELSLEDKSNYDQFFLIDIDPDIWYIPAKIWQDILELASEQREAPKLVNFVIHFMEKHPECEWKCLEKLLRKRKDLERSTIKIIMRDAESLYIRLASKEAIKDSILSKIRLK